MPAEGMLPREGAAAEGIFPPIKEGCILFLSLGPRLATSTLTFSLFPLTVAAGAPKLTGALPGDAGGVIRFRWASNADTCTCPAGSGGGTKPNFWRYCSWAECGARPSSSAGSKLKTANVPSEETAYSVSPSYDLEANVRKWKKIDHAETYQLRSMIWRSKTSFATINGRADLVCHTETDRSSAPRATTEQIFEVTTATEGSRRKM